MLTYGESLIENATFKMLQLGMAYKHTALLSAVALNIWQAFGNLLSAFTNIAHQCA